MSDPATISAPIIAAVSESGYTTRQVVPPSIVEELLVMFGELDIPLEREVYRTFVEEPRDVARRVDLALKQLLGPVVETLLPTHEIILGTFVYKGAFGPSIDYHQDWTFTDEREHLTVLFWIPLVDVDAEGGTLGVIPGSHRWTDHIRTSSHVREGPTVPHQAAMEVAAVALPLDSGDAVVYTPATLHGSGPNLTEAGRPAVILITVPTGAPILHFCELTDEVRGYVVDEAFFSTTTFESEPVGRPPVEPWTGAVAASDFDGPLGVVPHDVAEPTGPVVHAFESAAPRPRLLTRIAARFRR